MPKETAEEKLLKMMQKSAPSGAAKSPSLASPAKPFKFTFTVGTLNALLFLAIFLCLGALILEWRSGVSLLNEAVTFPPDSRMPMALSDKALPTAPGLDYYLRKINERNIFRPYVPKAVKKAAIQGLMQLMSKYKLVGVAWLDMPETATIMIEDTRKHETFFLKQGEQLEGVTVKAIYTDRAVFSHENEETTIKL